MQQLWEISPDTPVNKPERKLVPTWMDESALFFQNCFSCTEWDAFRNNCVDLNEMTETVCIYVLLWVDDHPRKSIKIYPHNKPWVSKSEEYQLYSGGCDAAQGVHKASQKGAQARKCAYKDKLDPC